MHFIIHTGITFPHLSHFQHFKVKKGEKNNYEVDGSLALCFLENLNLSTMIFLYIKIIKKVSY